ncbi:MAG: hypothetical protein PHQ66_02495 [Candidatus Nanoarchaeia archaeon]|nr:hypothetical protein [Candidatus Nanoarchaeia archaeon]MDD5357763.1 hypothetical protein [Candidatus Nanoarchaeia archaeon]MDD5588682.1 hypothetical protein [Candidatus Nanoarchaeia archaeon]
MKVKEKTEEMPEGFKLIIKWIFLVVGVPGLVEIFLRASIQQSFETMTSGWQIFIVIMLIIIFVVYEVLSIKYLVEKTKDYFNL